jgi:hypothetical protein
MKIKNVREGLIAVLLLIAIAWMLWCFLSPMLPYVVVGLLLIGIYQVVFSRRRL